MDRDALQHDLDQILGPHPKTEPIGEWDREPPARDGPAATPLGR